MSGLRLLVLVLLSAAMAVASFIGGMIPIKLSAKFAQFNYMSFFGMGILIGTSLVLIIPEGIRVLYQSLTPEQFESSAASYIGLALVSGFMIMFIQDNLPMIINSFKPGFKFDYVVLQSSNNEPSLKDSILSIFQTPLTLGLILHALIDGISLGSSFVLEDSSMGLIFFIIIIIHKLPTAFSLTSVLIKEGLNLLSIQVHLIIFSLMTPIGAIVTYLFIMLSSTSSQFTIAMLFLFSAGTFLYVIHHVMAHVASRSKNDTEQDQCESSALNGTEFVVTVAGVCIPIILSLVGED